MILRKQKIICGPWNMALSVKFQERIQGLIKHDGACLWKYLTIATRLLFSKKNYFVDNTRQGPKCTPEPFLWFKTFTTRLLCWLMISRFTERFSKKHDLWWLLLRYFQALVVIYSKEPSIYHVRKISKKLALLTPLIHTICSRIGG